MSFKSSETATWRLRQKKQGCLSSSTSGESGSSSAESDEDGDHQNSLRRFKRFKHKREDQSSGATSHEGVPNGFHNTQSNGLEKLEGNLHTSERHQEYLNFSSLRFLVEISRYEAAIQRKWTRRDNVRLGGETRRRRIGRWWAVKPKFR